MSNSLPHHGADPVDPPDFWPFKLELHSPGFACVWRPIRHLVAALRSAGLDKTLDTNLADQVALLLEPQTFGDASYPLGDPLAAIAAAGEVTPRQAFLCLLAATELPDRGWDLDLSSEELAPRDQTRADEADPLTAEALR